MAPPVSLVGRPRGGLAETQQRRSELQALRDQGLKPAEIAEREGLTKRRVNQLLAGETDDEPEQTPRPKPRMTKRTLAARAALAMYEVPALREPGMPGAFWLRVVVAIHQDKDATQLTFGRRGDLYGSRAAFLSLIGGTEADLAELFHRELLEEAEGGGVALPYRFGLRPGERPADALTSARPSRPSSIPSDPRQMPLPAAVMGGGSGVPEGIKFPTSGNEVGNEVGNLMPFSGSETADSRASATTTTTTTQESESLGSGSGSSSAGEAAAGVSFPGSLPETGVSLPTLPGGSLPEVGNEIAPERSSASGAVALDRSWSAIVEYANEQGRRPYPPTEIDLAFGAEWRDIGGATPDLARRSIDTVMTRKPTPTVVTLGFFTPRIRQDAAKGREPRSTPSAGATSSTPAAPVSAEDQALRALIKLSNDAWASDKACPFPPSLASFKVAIAAGQGILAHRWVEYWAAWDSAGQPGRAKPPDFTVLGTRPAEFEADLERAEEELTNPESD
jgi:hypothetical protein